MKEVRYKTILDDSEDELIEKKSKFIANIYYVENVKQAEKKIEDIKKKYYDAKHHCFAYRILEDNRVVMKSSDDGEPTGTAGIPMLEILQKRELVNIIVIVTRYFGGILLGTGGLLRAYTNVENMALKKCENAELFDGEVLELEIDYKNFENFRYFCYKNDINIIKIEYKEMIYVTIKTTFDEKTKILYENKEGKIHIEKLEIVKNEKIFKKINNCYK